MGSRLELHHRSLDGMPLGRSLLEIDAMNRTALGPIDTHLTLKANGRLLIGHERIALLEAVVKYGSITRAAEAAGFSYKTAWDSVNAINNLLPRPAFITKTGGTAGGGATVTEEGLRLIDTFKRLEEKLNQLSHTISDIGLENTDDVLFWGLGLKLSTRNAFHCTVTEIKDASINVEVHLAVTPSCTLTAAVPNASVADMRLALGRHVVALVGASSVLLAPLDQALRISARNRINGQITARIDDAAVSEITVDIGNGKTITSVITRDSADDMTLGKGDHVCAIFKTSHVILAAD